MKPEGETSASYQLQNELKISQVLYIYIFVKFLAHGNNEGKQEKMLISIIQEELHLRNDMILSIRRAKFQEHN